MQIIKKKVLWKTTNSKIILIIYIIFVKNSGKCKQKSCEKNHFYERQQNLRIFLLFLYNFYKIHEKMQKTVGIK